MYSLCKKWLFFQLNGPQLSPATSLTPKDFNDFFTSYLKSYNDEYQTLLEIPCLEKYADIFKKIRLHNLLNDLSSYELLKQDLIVPMKWMEPFFVKNWLNIIFVDQNKFSHEFEIERPAFDENCLRFGRVLSNEANVTWRWVISTFFSFTKRRKLSVKTRLTGIFFNLFNFEFFNKKIIYGLFKCFSNEKSVRDARQLALSPF